MYNILIRSNDETLGYRK